MGAFLLAVRRDVNINEFHVNILSDSRRIHIIFFTCASIYQAV